MNKRHPDGGEGFGEFEEFLRGFTPADLPSELRRSLVVPMSESRPVAARKRLLLAAAAVILAALPLGFWWMHAGGDLRWETPVTALSGGASGEDGPMVSAAQETLETTDVVGVEDAGTTPTENGAYRIVLVTLVHRMWETAGDVAGERVLSERTIRSYIAVPLEIF